MLKTQNLDLDEIRKGFEMFDVEQTGKISPSELLETFDAMNLKNKNPFIYNLISSLSTDNDEVSIEELISYIDEKLSDSQSQEGLNLIFDSLCEPNEETLTLSTLPQIARISEDKISEKELRYLIERAQMGGEEINFDEFLQIVKENSENEGGKNGMSGLKIENKGNQPSQQIYRKKASNKVSGENNKMDNINNKKKLRNENVIKNSEDKKSNIYDVDDFSDKKSKNNQRVNVNNNYSNNNNDLKKNDRNKFVEEIKDEKEKKNNNFENNFSNKNINKQKKEEDEKEDKK